MSVGCISEGFVNINYGVSRIGGSQFTFEVHPRDRQSLGLGGDVPKTISIGFDDVDVEISDFGTIRIQALVGALTGMTSLNPNFCCMG